MNLNFLSPYFDTFRSLSNFAMPMFKPSYRDIAHSKKPFGICAAKFVENI